ncbi:hypothetical protein DPMN_008557 [Dreissena polymorpha]|uniref:Uncharacterized protein n=1 Tax=Dreissena polymorpha TaxID=45954 RepID=A0A9D4MZJ5_DREPO|nr:hypothetical protein DPMN_008557 [Dreissena polymorpha]
MALIRDPQTLPILILEVYLSYSSLSGGLPRVRPPYAPQQHVCSGSGRGTMCLKAYLTTARIIQNQQYKLHSL